jgi:hypothetical protein
LKTLNTQLFLSDSSKYKKNNILLIDDSIEKNILNDIGNVVFLKSWKHTIKNSLTYAYLSREPGPWLEKLYKRGEGQVPEYVNENRLHVNPLVLGDTLYDYVMDGVKTVVKL